MSTGPTPSGYVWRPWKVVAVGVACLLTVAGGVLAMVADDAPTVTPAASDVVRTGAGTGGASPVRAPGAEGFGSELPPISRPDTPGDAPPGETPTSTVSPTEDGTDGESPWTPALLRGGLSFLVGFSLAYAARTFIKIALFFLGVWAASLFLLSSLGWIDVHWDIIDGAFEGWSTKLGEQFESARTFITGSLPSTGMAGLGLVTGYRRK
jgi:uncharacterized membrane protein (Fun14 family)